MKSSLSTSSETSRVLEAHPKTENQASIAEVLQGSRAPFTPPSSLVPSFPSGQTGFSGKQSVVQLAYAKTLKKIWLHRMKDDETEDRKSKVIIPRAQVIRLDETLLWQRGKTSLLAADFHGEKGFVKDKEGEYWQKLDDRFIEPICEALGITPDILWQPVDMVKEGTAEGNIAEYILAQMNLLEQLGESDELKESTAIVGVARALAQLLGDLGAENRIARRLTQRLYPEDVPEHKFIDALARSNPLLKFLHNELNLHDTAVLIIRRANRAGMAHRDMWELLKDKLWVELKSLAPAMYARTEAGRFDVRNSFGMYSEEFMKSVLEETGDFTTEAVRQIDRVKAKIIRIGDAPPLFHNPANHYAVKEARKHDEEIEAIVRENPQNLQDRMRDVLDGRGREDAPVAMIDRLVEMLEQADITILRKAQNMIDYNDLGEGSFRPGFHPHYISPDRLLDTEGLEHPETGTETKERADNLSFYPLLSAQHKFGTYYPLFRTFKDHAYGGNLWMKAKGPVFAALDYDSLGLHGFHNAFDGNPEYGDVVFVLDKAQLAGSVIYTNQCTGRSYTNLRSFLYDLLLQPSRDIYGKEFSDDTILQNLIDSSGKETAKMNGTMKFLEVQIYKDVPIDRTHVKEVIFNGSVSMSQRESIREQIEGIADEHGTEAPPMKRYAFPGIGDFLTHFNGLEVDVAWVERMTQIFAYNEIDTDPYMNELKKKYKTVDFSEHEAAIRTAYDQLKTQGVALVDV